MSIEKIREALEFIIERENERIEGRPISEDSPEYLKYKSIRDNMFTTKTISRQDLEFKIKYEKDHYIGLENMANIKILNDTKE